MNDKERAAVRALVEWAHETDLATYWESCSKLPYEVPTEITDVEALLGPPTPPPPRAKEDPT